MGLRFKKSINLGGGFKVNLSGSGVGFSWGVPGYRVTKTAGGKTRQTFSLPGTGLSYVTESGSGKTSAKSSKSGTAAKTAKTLAAAGTAAAVGAAAKNAKKSASTKSTAKSSAKSASSKASSPKSITGASAEPKPIGGISHEALRSIHRTADEAVDWEEILSSETPTEDLYDPDFWAYCHAAAPKVLEGDIDAYLQVIQDMNPYDDLLDFGGNFLFGTDRSDTMEVEFTAKSAEVMPSKRSLGTMGYNDLLQDYVCSVAVRTARDTFALLPVEYVKIHVVDDDKLILSVCFDRKRFTKLRFSSADPSDVVEKFPHNMDFSTTKGFAEDEELET